MKHKKYLRKQVDGDDSENVSGDDKEDDESPALAMKFIKKEGDERDDLVNHSGLTSLSLSRIYCQARVQVPNPLSQQAPNPDPKVRPSLKSPKTQFFGLG